MRFLAMLMTFVLTVGCVGEVSYAAEPVSKQEIMLETVSEGDLAVVDISDNLLQEGGLLKEYEAGGQDGYGEEILPNYLAVDRNTYNSVEALLKSAYDEFATECSLSQFQLTPEELKEIVAEVLNTNPRYFYVYGGYSYSSSGGYVTRILPRYDYAYEQAESMIQAYDTAVSQAVEGASSDWSDLEKALYINDYLTRNCEYDTTYTNYDAYDVFVSKTAVCQGYALAYLELAKQLGLSAEIVTSTSLNHAWNMIEINGSYYQEDATWNDPISDRLGRARHLYFMKSTEYYQTEADHFAEDDWVVSGGLTWTDASSKDYDGYFWNDIDVGFEYIDGYWYGFDGEDRIVKYDCNGSTLQEVEEVLQIDDVWRVTGSSSYYGSKYLGLGQFDGKLYYSNPYTIYHYNLNTKMADEVYSLSETEKTVGSIYAMHITPAGEVYYYLTPSLNTTGTVYLADVLIKGEIEPEVYTITYDLDGGENHVSNPTSYTENDSFVFEIPTKENFVFDGWYTDAEYTAPIVGISAGTTGNLVLYAKWVERAYAIRFDGNGSTSGQMSDMAGCLFDQDYILSSNAYERTGYVFKGWNTYANGGGTFYEDGQVIRNLAAIHGEIVTLYAQWELEEYTLTYHLNDGTNNRANPGSYTVKDSIEFANPTREGYVFGGWYTEAEYTNPIFGINAGTTGNQVLYAKWIENAYSISFDGNGSTGGQMSDVTGCLYNQDYTLSVNVFEREGYIFTGWNTCADGSGVSYKDGARVSNLSIDNGEVVILYAQWEAEEYTLIYHLSDGTNNSENPASYTVNDAFVFANPTRESYVFGGWYTDAEYANPITGISAGTTGNLELYAKWITNAYIISFDGNGSTAGQMPDMAGCLFDQDYTLTVNAYERTGYQFNGWNTSQDGTGVAYEDGASVRGLTAINGETVVLYAQWELEEYTLTYELGGGTNNSENPVSYTVNDAFVFASPTRENYVFGGWYTEAEYRNSISEISTGTTGNIVLYAKWIENAYSISFDGNGSTNGQMSDVTGCLYGQDYTLSTNVFEREGYIFTGWNTCADGSGVSYKDEASVRGLTAVNGETVVLYAQWELEEYTLTYELDGGTNNSENPVSYTVNDVFVFANPTREGYVFVGWYTDAEYTNSISEIRVGTTGTQVLYAKWQAKVYHISFNGNGAGSGKMSSLSNRKYGVSYTLTTNAYKRTGYTFVGWNTKADGTGTAYKNQAIVKNLTNVNGTTITLYAQWAPINYTIKFNGNGAGSGTMSSLSNRKYGVSYTLTTNAYKRTGYTFKGWNTKADGTGTAYKNQASVKNLTSVSGRTITLYAQWTVNKYTIKFNGNGATSGKMSSLSNRKYGTSYKLTTNAYKRTGYTFKGWNTKADGKGTTYKNQATVKNLTSVSGRTITLYAQWTVNKYTIKFNGNGATGGKMSSLSNRKYGTSYKLTANAYKRTGYTFKSWNTKKNGKGTTYKNQASIKNLTSVNGKTVTLYAQWKKQSYSITYKLNGGTNKKTNPSKYDVTTNTITLKAPTKKGYTFKGWYKDSKFKKKVTKIKKGSTGNITLYAKWVKKK